MIHDLEVGTYDGLNWTKVGLKADLVAVRLRERVAFELD